MGNTNWRGSSGGAQLNPGNLPSNLQQSASVSRQWGIKPIRIIVGAASASVATVAGNIIISDPQTTVGGNLFQFAVESTSQTPVIFDLGNSDALWRDFIVTGATATKCLVQIFYRM